MRRILFLLFILILNIFSFAQDFCPEYSRLMEEAQTLKKTDYRKALNKYNSAKTCSPSKRQEVDEKINELFFEIEGKMKKAKADETRIRKIYDQMQQATQRAIVAEGATSKADSTRIVEVYTTQNNNWIKSMTDRERNELLSYIVELNRTGQRLESDTLTTCLHLLQDARDRDAAFFEQLDNNLATVKSPLFWKNNTTPVSSYSLRSLDILYYWEWEKIKQAENLLALQVKPTYKSMIRSAASLFKDHRDLLEQNYLLPDTVIGLPEKILFALPSSDNNNYVWGYSSYEDYRKLQVRFLNLSLTDLSFTTDSLLQLQDTGRFYSVLATAGGYRYMVTEAIDYSLKHNKAEYKNFNYVKPGIIKLVDKKGRTINDFSNISSLSYFFSSDGNFLVTWNKSQLIFYNIKLEKFIPLPNSTPVGAMSFSPDSKKIAYYNEESKVIYFSDPEGRILHQFQSASTGVNNITDIEFTGNDSFLKIYNKDSIFLFDVKSNRPVLSFNRGFVKNIVVAPTGTDMLITCNREYKSNDKTYSGYMTLLVDAQLTMKGQLYSECSNFLFTPDEKFIVGYDDYNIMRWRTDKRSPVKKDFQTCLSFDELVNNGCIPFNDFAAIQDGDQIEKGARKLKDMVEQQTDPILKSLYFRQSRSLFNRLAYGNAKNIRKERLPFFYDWNNWIDNKLGNKNFDEQFNRQQSAIKIFDDLVDSKDSVYPQQIFYAANGNRLLSNLYDSLGIFNQTSVEQLKKQIALRETVFAKDPDNADNIYFIKNAFRSLSDVYDSIGWRNLTNRQYTDRLLLHKAEEKYFLEKLKLLPDSFGIKTHYLNSLAQLAPSYLYLYANNPKENSTALDSVFYYADKGLSLSPDTKFLQARFFIMKARAWLLKENGWEEARKLYSLVKEQYPELTKKSMLAQLQYLKDAGAKNPNIFKADEFLNKE